MTTWQATFDLVFRDSGVYGTGQTPSAQDALDMQARTNMMLNQWKRRRWLVYHLVDHSVVCNGSLSYTIGTGGVFNTPRPDQIDAAFARQVTQTVPNQPDYPLRIIPSYEEYSRIALKRLQAGPAWALFYDSGWPLGNLFPYPLMNSQYELHVIIKSPLDSVVDIADEIVLPPEYEEAIYTSLVNLTRAAYQLAPKPWWIGKEKAAMETLRGANFQIPPLQMPSAVRGYGGYNIFSDTWGPGNRG